MKKLLSLFLALLMLALPVISIAEEAEDLSFIDQAVEAGRMAEWNVSAQLAGGLTGDASTDAIVSMVVESIVLSGYRQGGEAGQIGFGLNLLGFDLFNLEAATAGEDVYLKSNLLNDTTIVFAPNEVHTILERTVNALKDMGVIDEAVAQEILDSMGESTTGAAEAISASIASADVDVSAEDFDTTALEAYVTSILEKATQADLAGQPENSDPAVVAVTIPMTAEDIVGIYEQIFAMIKSNPAAMQSFEAFVVTTEDGQELSFEETLDKALEALKTQLPAMIQGDIIVTAYYDGNDEPVAAVCEFTMKAAEDSNETIDVSVLYTRLTAADGVKYHFDANAISTSNPDNKIVVAFDFNDQGDNGQAIASVETPDAFVEITATSNTVVESDTVVDRTVTITLAVESEEGNFNGKVVIKTDATMEGQDATQSNKVSFFAGDAEVFTLNIDEITGDPVASIVTDDALRLAELSDEDFQNWLSGVLNVFLTYASMLQGLAG